jgi:hypothetical protein
MGAIMTPRILKFLVGERKMSLEIKRIYVAGAYSADNVITVLDNMRKGMRAGLEVLLAGYSPFVPWFDYHFQLMLRDGEELNVEDYYNYSMAWLEASDIVLVLSNSEHSKGTQLEIKRAEELMIPVVYSIEELKQWNKEEKDE